MCGVSDFDYAARLAGLSISDTAGFPRFAGKKKKRTQ